MTRVLSARLHRPIGTGLAALAGAVLISLMSTRASAQNFSGYACDANQDTCYSIFSTDPTTVLLYADSFTGDYRNIRWTVNGNYQGQFENTNGNYTWSNSPAGRFGVMPVLDNAVFDVSVQSCWNGGFLQGSTCHGWAEVAMVTPSDNTTLFNNAPLHPDGGSNLCLDLPSSDTTNGNQLQLWTCNGTAAQQWTYQADGTIHSGVNYNKCVDLSGSNTADGTHIQIWDCNGTFAQKWTYQGATHNIRGYYGHCIDVPGSNFSQGTKLQYYGCNNTAAQVWNR